MNSPIKEQDMRVFLDSVTRYFENVTNHPAQVKPAYLASNEQLLSYDFTGRISISGEFQGCIYFTAQRVMLKHLLIAMREIEHHDDNMLDLVGEVANTFAGNARRHFGEKFNISVPSCHNGFSADLPASLKKPYIIPIQWHAYNSALVVCLSEKPH